MITFFVAVAPLQLSKTNHDLMAFLQ